MRPWNRVLAIWMAGALLCSAPAAAASPSGDPEEILQQVGEELMAQIPQPTLGDEWVILGLARWEFSDTQSYFDRYNQNLLQEVEECQGVLHRRKYTEYARVSLALTALGRDPRDVGGYDLLSPLGDFEQTCWQGVNGPIWALIALDAGGYQVPAPPAGKAQVSRADYVAELLARQGADGGFSLSGGEADADITGMALQALAPYQGDAAVDAAVDRALACLSALQREDGGFASWGSGNAESTAQVLVALGELGISLDDPRFVKGGNTLLDGLMTYYVPGQGFVHTTDGSGAGRLAQEQGFYALVSACRTLDGLPSLYRMWEEESADQVTCRETVVTVLPILLEQIIQLVMP
jgi:hypothetical protein